MLRGTDISRACKTLELEFWVPIPVQPLTGWENWAKLHTPAPATGTQCCPLVFPSLWRAGSTNPAFPGSSCGLTQNSQRCCAHTPDTVAALGTKSKTLGDSGCAHWEGHVFSQDWQTHLKSRAWEREADEVRELLHPHGQAPGLPQGQGLKCPAS